MTLTNSQAQTLTTLYESHLLDDGFVRVGLSRAGQVNSLVIGNLVNLGLAAFLPKESRYEVRYARITLAGIAFLRLEKAAA